ncbi:unnamed protein product, partial [marine sediment metagenome]
FKPKDQVLLGEIEKIALKKDPLYIFPRKDSQIELVGKNRFKKQILRFGKWYHEDAPGGVLDITKKYAQKLVDNFKKGVIENVFVPFKHSDDPRDNTGNVLTLSLTKDGIDAVLEVDNKANKLIKEKKVKGVSASIDPEYMDYETGEEFGPVIRHVALVMEPYVKKLKSYIPLSEDKNRKIIIFKKKGGETKVVKKKKVKLTSEKPKSTPAKDAGKDKGNKVNFADIAKKKIADLTDKVEKLETKSKKMEAKMKRKDALSLADKWLREGRIVPVQKEATVALLCSMPEKSVIELTDKKTKKKVKLSA